MKKIVSFLLTIFIFLGYGCIEDGFTTSPSDQPVCSTDTLRLELAFDNDPSTTASMKIYNRCKKSLNISSMDISGENARYFRFNVDGFSGQSFSNIEIRPDDSIFVFVEATLPTNVTDLPTTYDANLDITTNGVSQSVVLRATSQNVDRLRALVVTTDTVLTASRPYQVFDSLVVAPGATLTLAAGTQLLFHDKAHLMVKGTLIARGTPDNHVHMTGDRTGNVVGDISFDIMSRQWDGVYFAPGSKGSLTCTDIRNTSNGVIIEAADQAASTLKLTNCRLHNSAGLVLTSIHANIEADRCEFAEGGEGLVHLHGGNNTFYHCTFANNYLFSAIGGPAIGFSHLNDDPKTGLPDESGLPYGKTLIGNSIIYGIGSEMSHGDLTGTDVHVYYTLLKSNGSDDDNFHYCIWDADPLFYTVRNEYLFDYRLQPESAAIGAGSREYAGHTSTDAYGTPSTTDLGAYVFTPPAE